MKNGNQIGCLLAFAVCAIVGLFLLRQFSGAVSGSDPDSPKLDTKAWAKLSVGMSKSQVSNLIGSPLTVVSHPPTPTNQFPRPRYLLRYANYWQYNTAATAGWQQPLSLEPHPNAYLVHFDTNDLVESWQTPEDRTHRSK